MDNVNQHLKHFCFVVCLSAIGFSFSGCGPSPAQLAIQESFTKARAEFRASDVRTAVLPLFKKYNHFDMDETIPTAEIPQIVSSLPMFKIAIPYDVHGFALDRNSLMFMAGGGFGHWGIIVCKDVNDRTIPRAYGKRVLLWADGVYFYRGE